MRDRVSVLVTDRVVIDNFAYFLCATGGEDPFGVETLIRRWSYSYDLFVRLLPYIGLQADGVYSPNDAFRDEIEEILDHILPEYVPRNRMVTIPASEVSERFDWSALVERLVGPPDPTIMTRLPRL